MRRSTQGRWDSLLSVVQGPPDPVAVTTGEGPPDYHPLSRQEIQFLLGINDAANRGRDADEAAGDRSWVGIITAVPVRLGRAVPGNRYGGIPLDSFVADVDYLLGQIFREYAESGDTLPHLDEFHSLLANERPNFGTLSPSLAARLACPEHVGRRVRYVRGTDVRGEYGAVVRLDSDDREWVTEERGTKVPIGPDGIIPET